MLNFWGVVARTDEAICPDRYIYFHYELLKNTIVKQNKRLIT